MLRWQRLSTFTWKTAAHCPSSRRRAIRPPNRGSSGSPPSTISRELSATGGKQTLQAGLCPRADQARRWTGSRLERTSLRDLVLDRLRRGWSPEQIAGWLACDPTAPGSVTKASIASSSPDPPHHTFLAALPSPRQIQAWLARPQGDARELHPPRFHLRTPRAANARAFPGHWEADLSSSTYGQAILVAHERASRFSSSNAKKRQPRAQLRLAHAPATLTAPDNHFRQRTEFAQHYHSKPPRYPTFFCIPIAPGKSASKPSTHAPPLPLTYLLSPHSRSPLHNPTLLQPPTSSQLHFGFRRDDGIESEACRRHCGISPE